MVPLLVMPHALAAEVHDVPSPAGLAGGLALHALQVNVPAFVAPQEFGAEVQLLPQVAEHFASAGQAADAPSQRSSRSQELATARHTRLGPMSAHTPLVGAP